MSIVTLTFLGTGTSQGVPVIACTCPVCTSLDFRDKRLRTSVFIETNDINFIIDTGPDFRQQMLSEKINRLDAVLFTHAHRDHTAGLDDVRAFNFLQNIDMPVYAEEIVIKQLKTDFAYIFNGDNYPGLPRVQVNLIHDTSFQLGNVTITPLPVMHMKLPVLGFRINDVAYITDANFIPEKTYEKLKGIRILILNALQREPHVSHFNLKEALEVVARVRPEKAYFTHISHKLGTHKEIEKELPPNVSLAYDGLKLHF